MSVLARKKKEIYKKIEIPLLSKLLVLYWKYLKKLNVTEISLKNAPKVYLDDLDDNLKGVFNRSDNSISLNKNISFNLEITDTILKFTEESIIKNPISFISNNIILQIFGIGLPANTFLHEATHAILNSTHGDESHGITKVVIGELKNLTFDQTAVTLFNEANKQGLLLEFFRDIVKA